VLWIIGPSALLTLGLAVLSWLTTYSFLYTALVGLAAFALAQLGLMFWAIRKSAAKRGPFADPGGAAPQPASLGDAPQREANWKALRFSIPSAEDTQDRLMLLAAKNEQSASPDPAIELLADSERARAQLRTERDEAREEVDALKKELDKARQASTSRESLPGDEELKQRSSELSRELFSFLEERAKKDPKGIVKKEKMAYNTETRTQYSQRFSGKVTALLNALQQRGWHKPADRDKFGSRWKTMEDRIRLIAEYLDAVGRRL